MPDRTQDLKNHRQVAVACKNYTDTEIKKSEERILSIVARNNVSYIDHTDEATYRFTAPANAKLLMLQSIAGNSVKYSPSVASDSTTAYQKNVPSYSPSIDRASASMNILGGMSYKVNQLMQKGNFVDTSNVTGVNNTVNVSNNVLTVTPTDTTNEIRMLIPTIQNHKYLIVFTAKADASVQLSNNWYGALTENYNLTTSFQWFARIIDNTYSSSNAWQLRFATSTTDNYYLTNVMVFDLTAMSIDDTSITTATNGLLQRGVNPYTYESYNLGSIRDTAPTSVKSVGVNVMGLENVAETTRNGVTYSVNNGVISLNGTVTSGFELKLYFDEITSGTYSSLLSINKTDSVFADSLWLIANGTSYNLGRANGVTNTLNISDKSNYIRTWLYGNESFTNVQIKITLIKGSTAPTTYIPYFSDTLAIDSNIQALDGYGWGVNDTYYNYVDFNAKKFIKKVGIKTYSSQDIIATTGANYTNIIYAKIRKPNDYVGYNTYGQMDINTLNNKFEVSSSYTYDNVANVGKILSTAELNMFWVGFAIGTTSEQMQNAINGFNLYYGLATPVETDISEYLDGNEIQIEPNGTLSFESTYNAYVPSDVSYNGVIKHALATAVKQDGFNLWDEVFGVAFNGRYGSINFIEVLPSTTYCIKAPYLYEVYGYDINQENGNGLNLTTVSSGVYTFTTPSNCAYIKFNLGSGYGNTYNHDICINISNQDLNGTYKPYKAPITRLLPNSEAKYSWGITTGVRNVRTYCDDEGNAVNEGSLVVGNQDLGLLSYSKLQDGRFYSALSGAKTPATNNDVANLLSDIYEVYAQAQYDLGNMRISLSAGGSIYTRNDLFTNNTIFKTAMVGKPLFYEKNATDTETLDDFDYFFDCEEGDTFTIIGCELLQCYATYSFLIKEAKSNE